MEQTKIPKGLFNKYPGKRVAIVDGKVVAVSGDAKQCFALAKKKYPAKEILIYHVPKKEERYHLPSSMDEIMGELKAILLPHFVIN